jgi:TonB family protein
LSATAHGFQNASYNNVSFGSSQKVRMNFTLQPNAGPKRTWVISMSSSSSVIDQANPGVVESVSTTGLTDPVFAEMREKLQLIKGQALTGALLNQMRTSIRESAWGERPVTFIVSSRGTGSSELVIQFDSAPSTPTRVRVSGYEIAPNLIQQVKPIYPQEAKDARIQGVVVFETDISKDGFVTAVRVVTGHPLLIQSAMDAVRQWVYKPVLLNGQAVDVVSTVTVNFTLRE